MGETDEHRDAMVRHIELLRHYFAGQDVYVSGDLLVYYEQGNPKKYVVPDAFVVKGIPPHKRRTYKIWIEGKAPDVAIETTSRKTKRQDTKTKPALYARLGIKEYFLFDPTQEYLDPPLQGHRLVSTPAVASSGSAESERQYQPIESDAEGALVSQELGLRLRFERGVLAFYRLDSGERVQTSDERVASAEERAADAEAQAARLREELDRRGAAP
jgi:Uma2 family endonuclease